MSKRTTRTVEGREGHTVTISMGPEEWDALRILSIRERRSVALQIEHMISEAVSTVVAEEKEKRGD